MEVALQRVDGRGACLVGMNRLTPCGGELPKPDGQSVLRRCRIVPQAGLAQVPARPQFIDAPLLQSI